MSRRKRLAQAACIFIHITASDRSQLQLRVRALQYGDSELGIAGDGVQYSP